MKFINTDGMAFIGPGSEWFWTAVSGIVLGVTFIAIFRQLRLQRGIAAFEQNARLAHEWESEPMLRSRHEVLCAIRDGAARDAFPPGADQIGNFWDGVGYLVRAGHIDRKLIFNSMAVQISVWWTLLSPSAQASKADAEQNDTWQDFEWLASLITDMSRKARLRPPLVDDAYIAKTLPRAIEQNARAIRRAEAMRTIVVERPAGGEAAPTQRPARR
jgi:hypothetical protein